MNKHPSKEDLVRFLYQDGDLRILDEVRTHIESCKPCQSQLSTWNQLGRLLDTPGNDTARNEVKPEAATVATRAKNLVPVYAALAASLLLGVCLGSWWTTQSFDQRMTSLESKASARHDSFSPGQWNSVRRLLGNDMQSFAEEQQAVWDKRDALMTGARNTFVREMIEYIDANVHLHRQEILQMKKALFRFNQKQNKLESGIVQVAQSADQAVGVLYEQIHKTRDESF